MTFKEWWIEYRGFDDPYCGDAEEAWEAARKYEREQCAIAAEARMPEFGREEVADAIKAVALSIRQRD